MTWLLGANVGKQLHMDDYNMTYIYIYNYYTCMYKYNIYIYHTIPILVGIGMIRERLEFKNKAINHWPIHPVLALWLGLKFWCLEVHNSHIGYMVNLSLSLFAFLFLFVFLANRSYDSLSDICRCLHVCCSRILQNEETNYLLATNIGPQ